MRDLAIAVFHRVYNILKSGIAVPHGNLNPLSRKLIPKFQRAWKFGCSRPPYDIALAPPEDFMIMLRPGMHQILWGLGAGLGRGKVRSFQMDA